MGVADRAAVSLELRRTVQVIERWSQRTMHRRVDPTLSPNETQLLNRIASSPPQRLSDLAQSQGVNPSTMTVQITRLALRGFVERVPDPADRRASTIELTDAGRAALDAHLQDAAALLRDALTGWSDAELARFSADLRRFADDLDQALATATRTP